MKTIAQKFICIILLCSSINTFGQTVNFERETATLNCFYAAFKDNGVKFKNIIKNAETTLIEEKLLKDASGESYLNFFKNLEKLESTDVKNFGIQNYILKMMVGTNEFNIDTFEPCINTIRNEASFEESRMNKNTEFIRSLGKNKPELSISEIRDAILKRFTAKDFTHDYYKLMTFTFIEAYRAESTIDEVDLNKKPSAKEMETALIIELTEKELIFIGNNKMTFEELNKKAKAYLQKGNNNNLIVIKVSKNTSFKFYIKVENEVNKAHKKLRDQLSIEKYNVVYNQLKLDQKTWIDKEFPIKIVEIIK